jgi:hypothetical protein
MAKAKVTPVKSEPTIVLTREQFQKLREIEYVIDRETSDLKDTIADTDLTPIEIGFNIGSTHAGLIEISNQLEKLLDSIQPEDLYDDWTIEEDEN